jgi:hypothetical protein
MLQQYPVMLQPHVTAVLLAAVAVLMGLRGAC